jgi:hypothetical protein
MGSNRLITGREQEEHKMAKVTEKTVKVKVVEHPRAMYYFGKTTRDHLHGRMMFMTGYGPPSDTKAVRKFLGRVKPDDIVGVSNTQYKVVRVEDNHKREEEVELSLIGINIFTKQEETLPQAAISLALGSGYCDILYRKGKPYGIKATREVKVKIVDHTVPDPTPTP